MDNGSSCGNKNKDLNWRGMLEFWRTMYQTLLFYLSRKIYPFFSRSCSSPTPAVWFRVDWDAAKRSLPIELLLQGAQLTKGPSCCTLKHISKFAWRPRLLQAAPANHWVWQEYQGRSIISSSVCNSDPVRYQYLHFTRKEFKAQSLKTWRLHRG